MDDGGVTAGDVVGDEIDKNAEVLFFGTGEESFELFEPLGGIDGVVGADIVVVADSVGAASDALEKVGIVGGKLQRGVVAGGGLAVDACDPDGVEAELFDRGEGGVVEVGKFSATVLPVMVMQSPCKRPAFKSVFMTWGMPPAWCKSTAKY